MLLKAHSAWMTSPRRVMPPARPAGIAGARVPLRGVALTNRRVCTIVSAAEWPGMKREKNAADKGREAAELKTRSKSGGRGARRGRGGSGRSRGRSGRSRGRSGRPLQCPIATADKEGTHRRRLHRLATVRRQAPAGPRPGKGQLRGHRRPQRRGLQAARPPNRTHQGGRHAPVERRRRLRRSRGSKVVRRAQDQRGGLLVRPGRGRRLRR